MPSIIDLDELGRVVAPGMTPAIGARAAEGAAYCLESEGHIQVCLAAAHTCPYLSTPSLWLQCLGEGDRERV